jgi:hypothetical protein
VSPGDARRVRLVPPVGWDSTDGTVLAPRPPTLDGMTIGLLANGKANGDRILDMVVHHLQHRHRITAVVRATKAHPSLPMSDDVLAMFAEHAHAVLTAIGD